jgi:tetratricopeptide (TPR) repeat protein
MKRIVIVLFLGLLTLFSASCGNDKTTNENQNTADTATPIANENQNTAKKEDVPVPTFTDAETALAEGNKYLEAIETEKAIDALKQAVKLNPDLAEAYFQLGIAYSLREKELENAQVVVEEEATPTKKGKKDEPVLSDSDKAFENAAKAYEKILKKDAKNAAAHFNLGRSYNKLNKDKEAEKALRQAVKLSPEDSEYQTELGAILIKLAQYEEAVRFLKKAVELDENNSYALDLLEKAEAGKKRIDFANKDKPKTEKPQPQMEQPQPKEKPRPKETPQPKEEPSPKVGNSNK